MENAAKLKLVEKKNNMNIDSCKEERKKLNGKGATMKEVVVR